MLKTLLFVSATALFAIPVATASEMAAKAAPITPATYEKSFNVFFQSDGSSLTPEGKAIISAAANRFASNHGADQRVFVVSTEGGQFEDLSVQRASAVKNELERDGVRAQAISSVQHSQAMPATLQNWQDRRIMVALGNSDAFAKVGN